MPAFNTFPTHVAANAFAFEAGGVVFEVPVYDVDEDADYPGADYPDDDFFNDPEGE